MPKFAAYVSHTTVAPGEAGDFETVAMEADNPLACARRVAEIAARRRFGDDGIVPRVSGTAAPSQFRAFIGANRTRHGRRVIEGQMITISLARVFNTMKPYF